jgi:hypothetical protein
MSLSPSTSYQPHRRRRSAHAWLKTSAWTPNDDCSLRPTSSRSARNYSTSEAFVEDDEHGGYGSDDSTDEGDDGGSSDSQADSLVRPVTPHTPTRSGFAFSLTHSERAPLLQAPTTPDNCRPVATRHAATDPGDHRTFDEDNSSLIPNSCIQRHSSPCGRKSYIARGGWLEKHVKACSDCQSRLRRGPNSYIQRHSSPCGRKSYIARGGWLEKHIGACSDCQLRLQRERQREKVLEGIRIARAEIERLELAREEQAERERAERERAERERAESERAESERAERERAERERAERERVERERVERERAEREQVERARAESERAESERAEREDTRTVSLRVDESKQIRPEQTAAKSSQLNTEESFDSVSAKDIHFRLIRKICTDLTSGEEDGHVYLVRNPERKGLLKIGSTKNYIQRKESIQINCGIQLFTIDVWGEIACMRRTEALAQIELQDLRRNWECAKCGRTHGEWFEIDEKLAITTVDIWVKWMRQAPYTDRRIDPLWAHLIGKTRQPEPRFANSDHEAMYTHWEKALEPPTEEELERFENSETQPVAVEESADQRNAELNLPNVLKIMTLSHSTRSILLSMLLGGGFGIVLFRSRLFVRR